MSFKQTLEITNLSIQTKTEDCLQSSKEKMAQEQTVDQERSVSQLPSDFLKTPYTTYQPDYCAFALPDCLIEFLKVQARLESIDGRSLLLAAFNALLYRYTQQETIYLKLRMPNDKIDGDYTTEIHTKIDGELKVRELIRRISVSLSGIRVKSEALQGKSLTRNNFEQHSSLPSAMTFAKNFSRNEDKEQWITKFQQKNSKFTSNSDLHLVILQQEQNISGILNYNANLFKPDTIKRLSEHLQVLVEGIVNDLDCPIAQLPLLTQAEEYQLLVEWKSASIDYPQIPIYRYIEGHAIQQPDAIALTFKKQHFTYTELNRRANQLAHYLNSVGVGAEARVAVCLQPSWEIVISLLGIFKAGGVYVPLDPTYPADRLAVILEDTQPKVLLTQSHLLPNLPALAEYTFCFDQNWETIQHLPTHNPENEIHSDQTAYLIYTSGTTGLPKGVMTSHSNLVNYILVAQERFGFDHHDVMPAIARFTFSITMFELLSPLFVGGTLVILEREHILDFKRMTQTLEQMTVVHMSPSLMRKLLAYIKDNNLDVQKFHGLRHVSSGGDLVPAELLETMKDVFQNAEIYVIYGCSEVSCMGCSYPVARNQVVTKSRVGKPFNNVSVRLYDSHQNLVPAGIRGEIYISGAGVTKGYLNREDLTQEKFVTINGQRFYRTGDSGRLHADGNLEILGRADFQIKLRGIRIELGEIESALRQSPGVREGVVVARELGSSEKSLVAYVVLEQAQNPTIRDIRRFLQAKLPDYMVPAAFVVLEAMPLNLNQKVDRRALPLPTPENLAGFEMFIPPRDEWEQQLTKIWEEVLGIQPIGIKNNFFELGGDSLLAVQILTQIERQFGRSLAITIPLYAPTVEDLAKVLRCTEEEVIVSDLVPLRSSGTKPSLFCIYGILLYRELADHLDSEQPVYGVYVQEEVNLIKMGRVDQQNPVFTSIPNIAARYLQAIRTIQPHGPYYLAGESFGGIVAFEMAQQLQAAGEETALVALFDSWAPNSFAQLPLAQRLKLHWQLLLKRGLSYPLEKVHNQAQLLQRKLSASLHKVYQRLCPSVESTPQSLTEETEDIRKEVSEQLSRLYVPKPYFGKVVLFRAMERDAFEVDGNRDMGWKQLTAAGLQIFDVPGDHLGILKDPNVRVMAEQLKLYLA